MPPKTRASGGNSAKGKEKSRVSHASAVPEAFQDLLAETLSSHHAEPSSLPRKRRRVGERKGDTPSVSKVEVINLESDDENDDDDNKSVDFEDVLPLKTQQTAYNDSGESDDNESDFEDVGPFRDSVLPKDTENQSDLVLTLNAESTPQRKSVNARRKAVTKADRSLRLEIHKMNLLCLLRFVDRRNNWCNDKEVQTAVKPLLTKKMIECLRPKESYSQFGKAESVKRGLTLMCNMWESKFNLTARGLRRPFWAESEADLSSFKLSPDFDPPLEKEDFQTAARYLEGSRDVGAQLFCGLARSAGLEARLVCSLQPLPFTISARITQNRYSSSTPVRESTPEASEDEAVDIQGDDSPFGDGGNTVPGMPFSPRRRLGHPNAANYFMPQHVSPPRITKSKHRKRIVESPYPVFWVEVLDEAHQKWIPVDPFTPASVAKPSAFEPPASDPENNMSYVIAFEHEGTARDVTRRYTQAYAAKTRKSRVESTDGGERWWRRTLRFYSRGWKSDLDQIEDTELTAKEAREPMPRGVADFKDHPTYALERHLRKHEVLVSPREIGKVAAGRESGGGKKLESVYRRSDVKAVKSADGWYRIGREVKVGEQPVKIAAKKLADDEEDSGTGLYTEAQTELYQAPPVVNGRIPKNTYGNLDIYVGSMVPKGGVHIPDPAASRAARLLRVDYADAVTGFEFRGRHGTAVIKGVVTAAEYKEAIEAVLEGYKDEQARAEEEMRSLNALRLWKKFMFGLRIKERVDGYEVEGENTLSDENQSEVQPDDDSGMEYEEYVDDGGGGFLPE